MAADIIELLQLNYAQQHALKSVDEKIQSVMGGKLFLFCRTVFG